MGSELNAWALDLDGVIWRGSEPVPGSAGAVGRLREAGAEVAFVTNSALRTPAQVAAKLEAHGIAEAEPFVITAAMAAATRVEPGERVLVIGSEGLHSAMRDRGVEIVSEGDADAVVVGITDRFDYSMMTQAMKAIRRGARFLATNTDPTFPTDKGLLPGNGALVAAIAEASGRQAEVAGKPNRAIADLLQRRMGGSGVMVGDRPDTDGGFASTVGYDFALVLSGVTSADDLPVEPVPAFVGTDLASVVDQILDGD